MVIPLAKSSSLTVSTPAWKLAGVLLLAYVVIGLISGVLAGLLAFLFSNGQGQRTWASASLPLAFALNLLLTWPPARSEYFALFIAISLIAVHARAIINPESTSSWTPFTSPWIISILLVSGPSFSRDYLKDSSGTVKTLIIVLVPLGVSICSWVLGRNRILVARWPEWARTVGALLAVPAVCLLLRHPLPAEALRVRAAGPGPANVILIVLDTVRADHLSVYGYARDTTPNLKKFAQQATVYTRASAASDLTLPSHASMFTGLYPSWHGAHFSAPDFPYGRPLDRSVVTLPQILQAKGYSTLAIAANPAYLDPMFGLNRGFDVYDLRSPVFVNDRNRPFFIRQGVRRLLGYVIDVADFDMRTRRAEEINQDAIRMLEQVGGANRPFFLFLNYMDAHTPYIPPGTFKSRFPGRDPSFTLEEYWRLKDRVVNQHRKPSRNETEHLVSQYDGGIAYLDSELGELFARLKRLGLYDRTMIIVTADHGEAFGERQLMEHGVDSVYQSHIRVPLLVKYPGVNEGRTVDTPVSHVDFMPTVLDVLHYEGPKNLQGTSLRSEQIGARRYVISEAFPGGESGAAAIPSRGHINLQKPAQAVLSGPWKLIINSKGQRELYDTTTDVAEEHNLVAAQPEEAQRLESALVDYLQTRPRFDLRRGHIARESLDGLRSLGYVQ